MTFKEKIEQACKDANILTQKELAEKAHTTTATISRYISGHRTPSREALDAIAEAVGVSRGYFDECFAEKKAGIIERAQALSINESVLINCYREADSEGKKIILKVAEMEADRQQESQENLT